MSLVDPHKTMLDDTGDVSERTFNPHTQPPIRTKMTSCKITGQVEAIFNGVNGVTPNDIRAIMDRIPSRSHIDGVAIIALQQDDDSSTGGVQVIASFCGNEDIGKDYVGIRSAL